MKVNKAHIISVLKLLEYELVEFNRPRVTYKCDKGHIRIVSIYDLVKGCKCGHRDCVRSRISDLHIDRDKDEKQCGICGEIKSLSRDFTQRLKWADTYCKTCRTKIRVDNWYRNKIKTNPESYLICTDELCSEIWNKNKGSICLVCSKEGRNIDEFDA